MKKSLSEICISDNFHFYLYSQIFILLMQNKCPNFLFLSLFLRAEQKQFSCKYLFPSSVQSKLLWYKVGWCKKYYKHISRE